MLKLSIALICLACVCCPTAAAQSHPLYGLTPKSLAGEDYPLTALQGKVVLVVNTASKCGLTGQYAGLEKLWQSYKDRDFILLGVPANDFGKQEPGSNAEIQSFCQKNYGVSFPMLAKVSVKGKQQDPLYKFLTSTAKPATQPSWNFTKYLISRDGKTVTHFGPRTKPEAKEIKEAIDKALASTK